MKAVLLATCLSSTALGRVYVDEDDIIEPIEMLSNFREEDLTAAELAEQKKKKEQHDRAMVKIEKKMARKNIKVYAGDYFHKYADAYIPKNINVWQKIKNDMHHQDDTSSKSDSNSNSEKVSDADSHSENVSVAKKTPKTQEQNKATEEKTRRAPVELERAPADHSDVNADLLTLSETKEERENGDSIFEYQPVSADEGDGDEEELEGAVVDLSVDCDVFFTDIFASITALDQCLSDKKWKFQIHHLQIESLKRLNNKKIISKFKFSNFVEITN